MSPIAARAANGPGRAAPLTLLAPVVQSLWGWPAVANFTLGGLGAGLYVVATVTDGFTAAPSSRLAGWLGPLLILAGFGAVAGEAGRPFRGPRVLLRVRTSWMSRELWLGGVFAVLAAAGLLGEGPGARVLAAVAAIALAVAQGEILRHARGVTVWATPPVPLLFLTSALVTGAGLLLGVTAWSGRPLDRLLGTALALLISHACVWFVLVGWSSDEAFRQAVRPLHEGSGAGAILVGGHVLPSLFAALAVALPRLGPWLAVAAGALAVAGQAALKATLILQAGQLRPITLELPPLERRSP